MPKWDRKNLLLTLQDLKAELLSYNNIGFQSALTNNLTDWYELASYTIEKKMVLF
jgi:hypothetical protein